MIGSPLVRGAISGIATCCSVGWAWSRLDCPPKLFLRDKWIHSSTYRYSSSSLISFNDCSPPVLWIVGASSGIGEEFAYQWIRQLQRHNFAHASRHSSKAACHADSEPKLPRLVLSARSKEKLEQIVANCHEIIKAEYQQVDACCEIHTLPLDVTNLESLRNAVKAKIWEDGMADTVLMNAGQGHLTPAAQTFPETCQQMLQVNALWPMWLVSLLHQQRQEKMPHLVVTSSVAGLLPVPLSAAYSASKHALMGYFRSVSCENPSLQVTMLCPGPVDTGFHRNSKNQENKTNRSLETSSRTSSPMKMPVERCVRLMLSALHSKKTAGYQEVWICPQPTLSALFCQKLLPIQWTQYLLSRFVGAKRVKLWQQGADLYDPKNWK